MNFNIFQQIVVFLLATIPIFPNKYSYSSTRIFSILQTNKHISKYEHSFFSKHIFVWILVFRMNTCISPKISSNFYEQILVFLQMNIHSCSNKYLYFSNQFFVILITNLRMSLNEYSYFYKKYLYLFKRICEFLQMNTCISLNEYAYFFKWILIFLSTNMRISSNEYLYFSQRICVFLQRNTYISLNEYAYFFKWILVFLSTNMRISSKEYLYFSHQIFGSELLDKHLPCWTGP